MVKSPLILISSGRDIGELSIIRRQSELYGLCLHAAGAGGALFTGGKAGALACRFDGLLLAGGGDLHPARYGQICEDHHLQLDPVRDAEEEALFTAFHARRKPIFGICRGVQVINVLLGGTLHQHIEGHADGGCHPVCCLAPLAALIGTAPTVNSYHHQAIDRPGDGLHVAARAPDGTVEALLHTSAPILGVQWHPERMVAPLCEDVQGENHLCLFQWLVERC